MLFELLPSGVDGKAQLHLPHDGLIGVRCFARQRRGPERRACFFPKSQTGHRDFGRHLTVCFLCKTKEIQSTYFFQLWHSGGRMDRAVLWQVSVWDQVGAWVGLTVDVIRLVVGKKETQSIRWRHTRNFLLVSPLFYYCLLTLSTLVSTTALYLCVVFMETQMTMSEMNSVKSPQAADWNKCLRNSMPYRRLLWEMLCQLRADRVRAQAMQTQISILPFIAEKLQLNALN